jgi:hypothetical protein
MSINLKVIGAGMGRTGTTSLKLALELLLGGDCFHFLEYKTHPELMLPWQTFVESCRWIPNRKRCQRYRYRNASC